MPTYEYRREDGSVFEQRQSINDEPLATCPETGQKVKRLISGGGGVVYKGEGWYVTDYKKPSSPPANGSGDSAKTAENESEKKEPAVQKKDSAQAGKTSPDSSG